MLKKMLKKLLELLYPPVCIFCGKICGEGICAGCRKEAEYIREPLCKKCGKPVRSREAEFCHDCREREFYYEQGRSLWLHKKPVNTSIYAMKYRNRRIYSEVYAKEMADRFGRFLKLWKIDRIVPVPLHRKRKRRRGFNQAELVAQKLGEITGIPVDTELVIRSRYTAPQKELGNRNRRKNLKNAFRVTELLNGENVLILDDIYTTGSTIDIIAQKLLEAGAEKTYFLTISIGQGF